MTEAQLNTPCGKAEFLRSFEIGQSHAVDKFTLALRWRYAMRLAMAPGDRHFAIDRSDGEIRIVRKS